MKRALALLLVLAACGGDDDDGGGADAGPTPDAMVIGADAAGYHCDTPAVGALGSNYFTDISEASGIRLGNFVPNPQTGIPINDHSRLGFADINGDHCDDIVAHNLFPNWTDAMIPFTHLVFVSNCDGTFTDFSVESGLHDVQAGFFAFADVDNDGDQDCYAGLDVPIPGQKNSLWLNDGQGHFTIKAASGVEGAANNTVVGNAVFVDANGDGNLDLYVGNGQTSYLAKDQLFIGHGDGTFTDESAMRLPAVPQDPSNGTVACDYDMDGDLDIFVAVYGVSNGGAQNELWQNDGTGKFSNVAVAKGFASLPTGNYFLASTGMGTQTEPGQTPGHYVGGNDFGLACADVNNDGYPDVYMTAISHPVSSDYSRKWSDPTVLLINHGPDADAAKAFTFENKFLAGGLPFNEGDVDGAIVDFDNDGLLDLSASRTDKYESGYNTEPQKGWFGLFHQTAAGTFEDVSLTSGINDPNLVLGRMKGAQNHAWSDIDNDGDLDLLAGGRDQGGGRPNFLIRNDIGSTRPWLAVRLVGDGVAVNKDAIGARVRLKFPGVTLTREVQASRGTYDSMDTRTLYFGLGELGCQFALEVRWPDGSVEVFDATDTMVKHVVTITYGQGLSQ